MNNEQKKEIQKCKEEIEKLIDNVNLSGSIDIDKVDLLYDLKKLMIVLPRFMKFT